MHAGAQPAHNKLRCGRSAHQVTLTPTPAFEPISRQFTETHKSFIQQYDQTAAALNVSFLVRQQVTNKSIRALISLICYN